MSSLVAESCREPADSVLKCPKFQDNYLCSRRDSTGIDTQFESFNFCIEAAIESESGRENCGNGVWGGQMNSMYFFVKMPITILVTALCHC